MKDLGVLVVVDDKSVLSAIERMFSHFKARVDYVRLKSSTTVNTQLSSQEYLKKNKRPKNLS